MEPESARRIVETEQGYQNSNEGTILNGILPLVLGKDHMKAIGREEMPAEQEGEQQQNAEGDPKNHQTEYVLEDWFEIGVATASNHDMLDGFMPSKYDVASFQKNLAKQLRKDDKMTTPRPDRCLGI